MAFKTISLGLIAEREPVATAAIDYALSLCDQDRAHLACRIVAPLLDLPTGRILPLAQALVDEVNAERLATAERARDHIDTAARLSGVSVDCKILQDGYSAARAAAVETTRASDLVILPQARGALSSETGLIESVLFGCGRPAIVVPADWSRGAKFERVIVAWDGGARAARAAGDALPLLARAEEVEVVCVTSENGGRLDGSDLAEHLSRHCRKLKLLELPTAFGDPGRTLCEHVSASRPDLLVMGAFGHSRIVQFVLGGVTSAMLEQATLPVFYSY